MNTKPQKPLNRKAYGSIGHLPGSRRGPGDHGVNAGMARICCERTRDKHDRIVVQEKLDGSCVAVALLDGKLVPLQRSGYPAVSSPWEQHRLFHDWVFSNADRFYSVLYEGERIVGEWLALAHGTRYNLSGSYVAIGAFSLPKEPFVAFDIMRDGERLAYKDFEFRIYSSNKDPFCVPPLLVLSANAVPLEHALDCLGDGYYGALDKPEGVVYRVERKGHVDFLAKYVRPDKVDGCYLSDISGKPDVWNWRPQK